MLNKARLILLIPFLLVGCHAAGPTALKVAKIKMKMKSAAAKHGFRTRAVTAMEKQYDANRNGVIDPQEAMFLKQRLMYEDSMKQWRKMDLDKDGVISSAEFEASREDQWQ